MFGDRHRDVQIIVADKSKLTKRRLRSTAESRNTLGYVEGMTRSRELLNRTNTADALTGDMLLEIMECHGHFCMSFGKNDQVWQQQLTNHRCEHTCHFFHRPGTSVYICRTSGNLHVCTIDLCERRMETREREREYCVLTGLCYPLSDISYEVPVSRIGGVGSLDDPIDVVTEKVKDQLKRKQRVRAKQRQQQRQQQDLETHAGESEETMSMLRILQYMRDHGDNLKSMPSTLFPGHLNAPPADIDTGDSSGASPVMRGVKRPRTDKHNEQTRKKRKGVVVVRRSKHTEMTLESSAVGRLDVYHTVIKTMTAHNTLDQASMTLLYEIVESLWALIITPREFNLCNNAYHLNAHVVSVLYRMWMGLNVGKWVVIPELRWVSEHLPDRRKLPPSLKLKPKSITATDKYFNAVLEHCTPENLTICHEEIQESLRKWKTQREQRT